MKVSEIVHTKEVHIESGNLTLFGDFAMPDSAKGVVVFAHGSGSGRHSPRNQFVAHELNTAGLGTLLLDLLTEEEAEDRSNVFDISLLADRVLVAVDWLAASTIHPKPDIGLFGASTGAAAALIAAAQNPIRSRPSYRAAAARTWRTVICPWSLLPRC